jgi:hypothetical protein
MNYTRKLKGGPHTYKHVAGTNVPDGQEWLRNHKLQTEGRQTEIETRTEKNF